MEESPFVGEFTALAQELLGDRAIVRQKANLLYELYLNDRLKVSVDTSKPLKRGESAFQTDICIFERVGDVDFPRVAIEFKEDITTHDVLTYSAKAGKHKQIYPCLRYGMLASKIAQIPGGFFVHNEHLDFFVAARDYSSEQQLRSFAKNLIETELKISRTLQDIHFKDHKVDYYCRDVIFKKLG